LKANNVDLPISIPYSRGGYRRIDTQSETAMKYLKWISRQKNISILQAANGREAKIRYVDPVTGRRRATKVDGLVLSSGESESPGIVFEVHGCYWSAINFLSPTSFCRTFNAFFLL